MKIKSANFLISNVSLDKCPPINKPEYAFIGRSNVGKSSLINAIACRKNLAKVSMKPGKTQTINHFIINEDWYLTDLPGYGYAKTSKKNRSFFKSFIKEYILKRKNLVYLFLLIDARIIPQKIDLDFMTFLGEKQIPFIIVFTKIDKLKQIELEKNINIYNKQLKEYWEEIPKTILSSSLNKNGIAVILNVIKENNSIWKSFYKG